MYNKVMLRKKKHNVIVCTNPYLNKVTYNTLNRPRSIYQYSSMTPRLSGQASIFGVVFLVSKSLLVILTRKPQVNYKLEYSYIECDLY